MILGNLLDRYDYFFVDLWGIVWDGSDTFPDSVACCREIIDAGHGLIFLSNVSEFSAETLAEQLLEAGLEGACASWLVTAGQALGMWIEQQGLQGSPLYVFGNQGLEENVRRAGCEVLEIPDDGLDLRGGGSSEWLVIGGLRNFDWDRMAEIVTAVRIGGLRVLLPNPDKCIISQDGRVSLAPGMVVEILEAALPGLEVVRLGKPYAYLYDYGFEQFGPSVNRERCLMIGDSLTTDVAGANQAGIDSLLVGQGLHQNQSLASLKDMAEKSGLIPNYYTEKLSLTAEIMELQWQGKMA